MGYIVLCFSFDPCMFLLELRPPVQEGLGRQEGEPGEARQHSSGLQVVEAELRIRFSRKGQISILFKNVPKSNFICNI